MSDELGHFSRDGAEKLARFYRQQGTRGQNKSGRPRRRSSGSSLLLANTDESIAVGGAGVVTIYDDTQEPPVATTQKETAKLGFVSQSAVGSGVNVLIANLPGGWRILNVLGTSQGDDGVGGEFTCCECVNSKLWVALEFDDLFGWRYVEFPKATVSSGRITHKIEIYDLDDESQSTTVTLSSLDCSTAECLTLDLSATVLNGKSVGEVYFGNAESCGFGCDAGSLSFLPRERNETFAALPTVTAPNNPPTDSVTFNFSTVSASTLLFRSEDQMSLHVRPVVKSDKFQARVSFAFLGSGSFTILTNYSGGSKGVIFESGGTWSPFGSGASNAIADVNDILVEVNSNGEMLVDGTFAVRVADAIPPECGGGRQLQLRAFVPLGGATNVHIATITEYLIKFAP